VRRYYDFHGLAISIRADAEIVSAIDSRLGFFTVERGETRGISFEYQRVRDANAHAVRAPAGPTRKVYEPVVGEVLFHEETDLLYLDFAGQVRAECHASRGTTRVSVCDGQANNGWLLSRPMLTLPLLEACKRRGLYSLHAAGVSLDGQALLMPGGSGSGKSTLALVLARAGFDYLGDDMLFLSSTNNGVVACAMPEEVDVTHDTLALLPELANGVTRRTAWPKLQIDATIALGARVARECTPRLLVFPQVAQCEVSRLEPISTDEALLELAPNVLLTQPAAAQAHLAALASLARSVPCYRLHTGRDFDPLASRLRALLLG
jgi:hypothetical protein